MGFDADRCAIDTGPVNSGLPIDAVGAVVFHPLEPLLLSVSGSRCFDDMGPTTGMPGDSDSDSESSDEGSSENVDVVSRLRERPRPSVRDASIKMWDFRGPVVV
ncbi:hypothetical protein JVT61DRAFT_13391 [Boletus reticuloceps]|uniref:Uncharacterized protein n=1 Tax=Boletus reticuloceps TaxID=495285 RepID=A0A8I2YDH8_9AGAM|nr:hypothetical protein JVT61DRAFT_13391 [Boletus reticuloceps]